MDEATLKKLETCSDNEINEALLEFNKKVRNACCFVIYFIKFMEI